MKVFLTQDVERVGLAGEIIKVSDGYAANFLFPKKLAVLITPANEAQYLKKIKNVENRKEVLASETSMLAEKIKGLTLTLSRKIHDNDKLYGSLSAQEIVEALAAKGVNVSKSQVEIDKAIKTKGTHTVIIKLSSRLKPTLTIKITANNE